MSVGREAPASHLACPFCGGSRFKPRPPSGLAWCGTCHRVFSVAAGETTETGVSPNPGDRERPADPASPA